MFRPGDLSAVYESAACGPRLLAAAVDARGIETPIHGARAAAALALTSGERVARQETDGEGLRHLVAYPIQPRDGRAHEKRALATLVLVRHDVPFRDDEDRAARTLVRLLGAALTGS